MATVEFTTIQVDVIHSQRVECVFRSTQRRKFLKQKSYPLLQEVRLSLDKSNQVPAKLLYALRATVLNITLLIILRCDGHCILQHWWYSPSTLTAQHLFTI